MQFKDLKIGKHFEDYTGQTYIKVRLEPNGDTVAINITKFETPWLRPNSSFMKFEPCHPVKRLVLVSEEEKMVEEAFKMHPQQLANNTLNNTTQKQTNIKINNISGAGLSWALYRETATTEESTSVPQVDYIGIVATANIAADFCKAMNQQKDGYYYFYR